MGRTVGIDLGTTNSEVAIIQDGQPSVLPVAPGDLMLPSCVGFSEEGSLLVGRDALRQYAAVPERTVRSIKRWMGTEHQTSFRLGEDESRTYLPHEISAMILKTLKQKAEQALGESVTQAVITVPAYFTDAQRQATKLAGEIAGLEVLQILNEPTAAALAYHVRPEETERVLVYDLGGGTFDVSVVEMTGDVTEVLASHGNNRLGGDDFDNCLKGHLAGLFHKHNKAEIPEDAATQARLLQVAEQVKIELSSHAFATVREAFIGRKGNKALHLETAVARTDFEALIRPLLEETLTSIDRALEDANLAIEAIDRVILVGGSTRLPLVREMIEEHLGQAPVDGVQPDLCVALGAAIQAGVLSGEAVDAILVDVCPHSLGVAMAIDTPLGNIPGFFSVIIPRNSVVPISRSEIYSTAFDGQRIVEVEVSQGEHMRAEENVPLGAFLVKDLPPMSAGAVQVEIHFDFDINGILTVTATEKGKGNQGRLVVNHGGIHRLSSHELTAARSALDELFDESLEISDLDDVEGNTEDSVEGNVEAESLALPENLKELYVRGKDMLDRLEDESDADELEDLLEKLIAAASDNSKKNSKKIEAVKAELEDFLYYAANGDKGES
jgi:molecular chaperone DnaK